MILGVQIINFDIFDNDQAGILIDESISPAADAKQRVNPMRKLNALIGRNNTGKTSFMGCLAYMKDCVTDGVTEASISCGRPGFSNMTPDKTKPSKFKVFFKLGDRETGKADYIQYELSILANRFGTPVVSYER
ncbi:MAG: ATP-binding protein, partial [Clostridiales bacterium]|nr:ATP-binding protein [Clostridiales bacterium]